MRARDRVFAAMVLCVATSAALAAEPAPASDCWMAGFKAGDAAAVSTCYADDAVMWLPGGGMAKGRAAILSAYTDFLGGVTIKDATLTQMGSEGAGDTHVAWGTFSVSLVDKKTNAESVMTGRYTDVQKMIGGKWLYIVDHASDDPAPAAK